MPRSRSRARYAWGLVAVVLAAVAALPAAAPVSGAPVCPCSLFGSQTPDNLSATDNRPEGYELGVKIAVDVPVRLTKIRFYKSPDETGTHVGRLWSAGGAELAQASFGGETASGWQEVALATPVTLSPGSTYVASVSVNDHFVMTVGGLSSSVVSGPLHSVDDGLNGVFVYGKGSFPTSSYLESNYFVDVVVEELEPPTATVSPTDGATGVDVDATASATFSREMDGATITDSTFTLEGPGGTAVPASVGYDAGTRTATLTPAASLAHSTAYTARLGASVAAADGVALGSDTAWTFTTEAAPPPPPPPPAPAPAAPTPAPAPDPHADVALSMTAAPGSPVVGSDVVYTLTASNLGPAVATGVVVENDLPGGVELRSATSTQGTCTTGASVRCALGTLAPGASARVMIAVATVASGEVANAAVATAAQPDPNSVNNRARLSLAVATRVLPVADAAVRVSLVQTRLTATTRRAARTWVAVDTSASPFSPLRLQLATDPGTPWSWRGYLERFSFRSVRPEIWIRLSDGKGTVTEWQAFRFAAAAAARSRR